jgi:hypothetical protein
VIIIQVGEEGRGEARRMRVTRTAEILCPWIQGRSGDSVRIGTAAGLLWVGCPGGAVRSAEAAILENMNMRKEPNPISGQSAGATGRLSGAGRKG